ncbi:hypothetical protein MS3_00009466 [Schistosoma haematobium]|uniref:Uncharacterized protein n=1 Tax=Schistosoma haematobium TaxID=6185 RepID=A0A922IIF1_SCHHA|nr:hypothetical protein MS3_00009466 [Schistosoma haematobium]KAH9579252.1 hypothetical protein MS3_00009466 [Schistosoma haematobium]
MIDNLDVIGKSQAQIVAILRIKPVGSIVHLLVRRQVHQCQLNTNNCLTCHFLLNSTYQCPNLLNTPMNQITNHLTCEKLSNWVDTRKCSSPPLQMTLYYDGLTNLERVYHPNYPCLTFETHEARLWMHRATEESHNRMKRLFSDSKFSMVV